MDVYFKNTNMVELSKFNENIPDFIKRNIFRPITIGILVFVITAQVLVVLHIHHSKNVGTKLSVQHPDSNRKNVTLKPLKLDQVGLRNKKMALKWMSL